MTTTTTAKPKTHTRVIFLYAIAMNVQPHIAIWVVYLTDFRDITLAQVALIEGFFWAVTMVMELPTGAFSDRFGRRTAFLAATGIEAAAAVAFGLAGNFELIALSYVVWGTGIALRSGSLEAYLYDQLDEDGAAGEYARYAGRMNALMTVSFMLGGVGGGLIAAATTLQVAVLVSAIPFVFAFAVALRMVEPRRPRTEARPSYFGTLAGAMGILRTVPTVRWLILFQTATTLVFVADFVFLQPFLGEYGTPVALFGILAVPIKLARIGGSIVSHRLLAMLGLRKLLVSSLASAVAGMLILGLVPHIAAFLGLALASLTMSAITPAADSYIHNRVSSSVRATVMSVMPLGMALLFAASVPLLGLAADVRLGLAFVAIAVFTGICGGGFLYLWHRADRNAPDVTPRDESSDDTLTAVAGG